MASAVRNDGPQRSVKFISLLTEDQVLCHTSITRRDELLHEMLKVLAYQRGIGNVEEAYAAVMEREKAASTVLAPGIAVPHARLEALDSLAVAVATSQQGVDFGDDSGPVKLIILVLAPKANPALYLQAVSSLAGICADPATAQTVATLETARDVWRFFDREGLVLPDYICAADIMNRNVVHLKEHDTLQRAVDVMVANRLVDVPVVDADGDLVGVVSGFELLRVCLPDYILWMEDLTPVLNFEPFAEVLKKEGHAWLTDVMSLDYPTVSEDVPAIQVAKEITRRGARGVFVVKGRKLVGVITIQDFIHKVLRE